MKALITTLLLLMAIPALAQQPNLQVRVSQRRTTPASPNHLVSLDALPLLRSGLGASYDYLLNDHLGLGINAESFEMKSDSESSHTIKSRVNRFGAAALLTSRHPRKGAFFARAGVVQANASTTMQATLGPGEAKSDSDGTGGLLSAGYMISGRSMGAGNLMINLAANYGYGNAVEVSGRETLNTISGTGVQMKLDSKLRDSMSFEARIGFLF